jgi:hypothetical protein|tara:strand:+ start:2825 stop:3439 length:615 start_codon:yes stop_codon:yes gene_type:complete
LIKHSAINLTLIALLAASCSSVRGEAQETNFGNEADAKLVFTAANERPVGIAIGSASVTNDGVARDAINFTALDLLSGQDIYGIDLFGAGSVIATFVEPGCEFSGDQGALLAEAASVNESTTFVFIHSGATPDAFKGFAEEFGLLQSNVVHLDDESRALSQRFGVIAYPSTLLIDGSGKMSSTRGALNNERLAQALSIVQSGSD